MKHTVLFAIMSAMTVLGLTGCNLDNDQKTALIAASVRITAMAGTKIAVAKSPDSVTYLMLVADSIEVTVGNGEFNDLNDSVTSLILDKVPSEHAGLIQIAITESLTLYDVFARENVEAKFDTNKRTIALALVNGIRSGLSSKSTAEDLSDMIPDAKLFRLN